MTAALVSIIIPVYNGANFVRQAIDSALSQTWPNIEVLLIDDGSTDGGQTAAVCKSYGDRIRYISKPNGGVGSALNLGIAEMKGDYFSWLSHDDLYDPRKVAVQMEAAQALAEPAIIFGDYDLINDDGSFLHRVRVGGAYDPARSVWAVLQGRLNGCTLLIPKACFAEAGIFHPGLPTTQDYELWFRFAQAFRFVHVPGALVRHRVHAGQGSKSLRHIEEANLLWTEMLESIDPAAMRADSGSELAFLLKADEFLQKTGYEGAKVALAVWLDRWASRERIGAVVWGPSAQTVRGVMADIDSAGFKIDYLAADSAMTPRDRFSVTDPPLLAEIPYQLLAGPEMLRLAVVAAVATSDASYFTFQSRSGPRTAKRLKRAMAGLILQPEVDGWLDDLAMEAASPFGALDGALVRRSALEVALQRCRATSNQLEHALGLRSHLLVLRDGDAKPASFGLMS